jgi:hypothetical protein
VPSPPPDGGPPSQVGPTRGLTAALAGAATLMSASAASAQGNGDVAALQTAASLEIAATTYETTLTLPFIGGDEVNAVKAFTMRTSW